MYVRLRTFAPLRKNPATSGRGDAELPRMRLRACADRLATFHICRFSERLNGLLIAHWHIRYPPIRAASKPLRRWMRRLLLPGIITCEEERKGRGGYVGFESHSIWWTSSNGGRHPLLRIDTATFQ